MDFEKATELVKANLSKERFEHTLRVKDTAIELAEKYSAPVDLVTTAALFHDYAKDMEKEYLKHLILTYQLPEDLLQYHFELWHGPVASKLIEEQFNITNKDVKNAIYYHTTGRANMSLIEVIVFVADYIEPGRNFPGVNEVREDAKKDIYVAARNALKNTIHFLLNKDATIHPDTFLAYNDLTKLMGVKKA
jgi:predicted HD superfamily hydrolase involved in NAD metabolism